jgi:hypothetical protein
LNRWRWPPLVVGLLLAMLMLTASMAQARCLHPAGEPVAAATPSVAHAGHAMHMGNDTPGTADGAEDISSAGCADGACCSACLAVVTPLFRMTGDAHGLAFAACAVAVPAGRAAGPEKPPPKA